MAMHAVFDRRCCCLSAGAMIVALLGLILALLLAVNAAGRHNFELVLLL